MDIGFSKKLALLVAMAAASIPSLLAYNVAPSPTFLNQALALALWGSFVAVCRPWSLPLQRGGAGPLMAALFLLVVPGLLVSVHQGLPTSLALSTLGLLLATAVLVAGGVAVGDPSDAVDTFAMFCWAWVWAGALNTMVAAVQVFTPGLPDGHWIAASGIVGRAVGNLRQPNHLSSLLLWSCIGAVALLELRRLTRWQAAAATTAFVFAVVLTASRTGLVSVLLLGLWGLLDRRLSRSARQLMISTPLIYALSWWGMAQWAALADHSFGGTARLAESDISGSRFGIWKNTWALIQAHPWRGVGWGEFNLAWTLTPFPGRPTAFFDHTHNLPLQLAVELGLPLAGLVLGLVLWAVTRAGLNAWRCAGDLGGAQRCAWMMVLMIGLHSLLEYPLWYAYFLLPTAWALGFALRSPTSQPGAAEPAAWRRASLGMAAWLLVVGAVFSVWDYSRVAVIFTASPGDPPLEQRIARGQRSIFFAHHADYAAVTSGVTQTDPARAFDRVSHYLLDTRLMSAWAKSLAERGELDAARHIAARLREFNKVDAEELFEPCPTTAVAAAPGLPFQCELPTRPMGWQAFLPKNR